MVGDRLACRPEISLAEVSLGGGARGRGTGASGGGGGRDAYVRPKVCSTAPPRGPTCSIGHPPPCGPAGPVGGVFLL